MPNNVNRIMLSPRSMLVKKNSKFHENFTQLAETLKV